MFRFLPRPCSSNAFVAPRRKLSRSAVTYSATRSSRRVVFSGIQPTGTPHLGNYLGALSNWVKLQNSAAPEDDLFFSIVGWHALTLPQNPKELSALRLNLVAVLLAIGLDPKRSVIFHQDENPHHTELAWVLYCLTSMGKLGRMTTWKSKLAMSRNANDESEVDETQLNLGLFAYPVLQAADVLLYKATDIPVGEDQHQHIELARDIADTFNRTFPGKVPLFPIPRHDITPSLRILSLRNPTSKMSKSAHDPNSRILLTDTTAQISAKIRSAVTDSTPQITYDPVGRPGTSSLLTILSACRGEDPVELATHLVDAGHGGLKKAVTEAVEDILKGPRAELERLVQDEGYLRAVARKGAEKARERSDATMLEVKKRIGLA